MDIHPHKVVVTDRLIEDEQHLCLDVERSVLEPMNVDLVNSDANASDEQLINLAHGAIALLVTYRKITREVLQAIPSLKLVVRCGIGFDNVDLAAADDLGIYVVNVPDYGDEEVAAHALALMLDGLRAVSRNAIVIREGGWISDFTELGLRRLSSLTVGTVGYGRIARRLHTYLEPLFPQRKFFDPYATADADIQPCGSVEDLFASCDVVSLHLPLNSETHHIVSERVLRAARPGLVLVNTARAQLIDRNALVGAIASGKIRHFGTDLAWEEPLDGTIPENRCLLAHPDVSITPHIAWYSKESEVDLRLKAATEIARVVRGDRPLNIVNRVD